MIKLTLVASMLLMATGSAKAFDGKIIFNGAIAAVTCTVKVNAGTSDGAIVLPGAGKSSFGKAIGDTGGSTNFTIDLTACTGDGIAAGPKVAVLFEPGVGVNAAGRLINTGTATDVDLAIYYNNGALPVNLGVAPAGDYGTITGASPVGAVSMPFTVKYYATKATAPGAGTVIAKVIYSIIYR